jgi:NTP pyrophosphatase (non-canonical NTP hydrolase)
VRFKVISIISQIRTENKFFMGIMLFTFGQICAIMKKIHHAKESTMNANEYQKLAMTTLNPALDNKDVLINSVMGLCGEAGEAIDIVKKWLAHGHELDREHLAKELGDIAWYLAEAATALDLQLGDILQANIEKLKKRYPEGFESKRSLERAADDV